MVESLVASAATWPDKPGNEETRASALISCLEKLTESLLQGWLRHSRKLRLSVIERIITARHGKRWSPSLSGMAGDFYAAIFEPGQIRALLHQGVANWLTNLQDEPRDDAPQKLLEDLPGHTARRSC